MQGRGGRGLRLSGGRRARVVQGLTEGEGHLYPGEIRLDELINALRIEGTGKSQVSWTSRSSTSLVDHSTRWLPRLGKYDVSEVQGAGQGSRRHCYSRPSLIPATSRH